MNLAVGLTAYDAEREYILDKSIGELNFMAYEWGEDENGEVYVRKNIIPSHVCSKEELGIEGDNSSFFPLFEGQMNQLRLYQKKFLCIAKEEMRVYGDWNSKFARIIDITLSLCHGHSYCKEEKEIKAWYKNKFLLMMYNKIRFDSQ